MKKISIIGAGPVGLLLALKLCRRGYSVEIFEKRPDIRKGSVPAGRSINLTLSQRGLHALSKLGVEKRVLSRSKPLLGRMVHDLGGNSILQRYGNADSECIHSISRLELNRALLDAAEKDELCEIYFNQRLTHYDFKTRRMHLHNELSGKRVELNTECIIGSDGSASALRESMVEQEGVAVEESLLDYGYKEFRIPSGPGGGFQLESQALHIWPREKFMLIAQPNFDGSFSCTLFLPFKGENSFEELSEGLQHGALEKFFNKYFQDATPLVESLNQTFHRNPTGTMITVKVDRWNVGGNALLVGDAAHAIVPFYGQGLNCGFEDCDLLDEELERTGCFKATFDNFFNRRKVDCDAIAQMALENFVEIRHKIGQPRFILEKEIERKLVNLFPEDYVPRYNLVSFSKKPYSHALRAGRIQERLLRWLSEGITSVDQVNLELAYRLISQYRSELKAL